MIRSRAAKVAFIIVALVVVGVIVAAVAQTPPISIGRGGAPAAASAAVNVNAIVVLSQAGTTRYVAAGTSQGLRIYEIRHVGLKYEVIDVTKE